MRHSVSIHVYQCVTLERKCPMPGTCSVGTGHALIHSMTSTINTLRYLAAARRAHLDYSARSRRIRDRRHERQAEQHERKAADIAVQIIRLVTEAM